MRKAGLSLILTFLLGNNCKCTDVASFHRTLLPATYWQPFSSPEEDPSTKDACIVVCTTKGEQSCSGYRMMGDRCEIGKVSIPDPSAPGAGKFLPDPSSSQLEVYLRPDLFDPKAVSLHVASLTNLEAYWGKLDPNSDDPLVSRSIPPAPLQNADGSPSAPGGYYKRPAVVAQLPGGGIVACGGITNADYVDKKCRIWDPDDSSWSVLPNGDMLFPHADGAGAFLHKRKELFAFCGRDGPDGFDTATKKAEVINLGRGDRARWKALPDAPEGLKVDENVALAISDTELLLIPGRIPGCCFPKTTFVFDASTHEYHPSGDIDPGPGTGQGLVVMACNVVPPPQGEETRFAICVGGKNQDVQTNRMIRFDISARSWLPHDPSYDFTGASATYFGSFLFFGPRDMSAQQKMILVHRNEPGDDTELWELDFEQKQWSQVTGTIPSFARFGFNFFVEETYTKLLV